MINIAAPAAPPTHIEVHLLNNSTTVFLSWRPPTAEHRNGIVRWYYVELTEVKTSQHFMYTTQDPHLLVNSLQPAAMYAFRIAAYTIGKGPFTLPFNITVNKEKGMPKTHIFVNTL